MSDRTTRVNPWSACRGSREAPSRSSDEEPGTLALFQFRDRHEAFAGASNVTCVQRPRAARSAATPCWAAHRQTAHRTWPRIPGSERLRELAESGSCSRVSRPPWVDPQWRATCSGATGSTEAPENPQSPIQPVPRLKVSETREGLFCSRLVKNALELVDVWR